MSNRTNIYMRAIFKSERIFIKHSTNHFRLNSVRCAKFRADWRIYRDFYALFTWNRTKKYIGAISKSEPIFRKLNTHHSRLNSLRCAKFCANRKIYRDFGGPFTLNRKKIYMGAISKSKPIWRNIILDLIHYAVPNFVQIDRYIGTLVNHLP